jgi:hypothetical protein
LADTARVALTVPVFAQEELLHIQELLALMLKGLEAYLARIIQTTQRLCRRSA